MASGKGERREDGGETGGRGPGFLSRWFRGRSQAEDGAESEGPWHRKLVLVTRHIQNVQRQLSRDLEDVRELKAGLRDPP